MRQKYRTLVNSEQVAELTKTTDITISTKCPGKWAFVDMETGQVWVHRSRLKKHWPFGCDNLVHADTGDLKMIKSIL